MEKIRTFICIELPEEVIERIAHYQNRVRALGGGVRWAKPAFIHLTLKFLGDVEKERLAEVKAAVINACKNVSSFSLQIDGTGAFPNMKRPRVYWLGFKSIPEMLQTLQASLEEELYRIGFAKEKRAFKPHLTLGRVKNQDGVNDISEYFRDNPFSGASFSVDSVTVMQSDLTPGGAKYTRLARVELHL